MNRAETDLSLQQDVDRAAAAALEFLDGLQVRDAPRGVVRFSPDHDVARWPGQLLPATYNATICQSLLGEMGWSVADRQSLRDWLLGFRQPSGVFRVPGMDDGNVFKKPDLTETWRYIDFHVTNYAMGAIEALGLPPPEPAFAAAWLEPQVLKAWLADRDLRDPWQEGNNIVNLGSFLIALSEAGDVSTRRRVDAAFTVLFDWHDRLQEPATGFWGVGQGYSDRALLHAFAGSMHNFHLYHVRGRALPYQVKGMDYVLDRDPTWDSACIDVDEIDLLVHGAEMTGHRRAEIAAWVRAKLQAVLRGQHASGGFADTLTQDWHQDGWVGGYRAAPGEPTTFATWFRMLAVALADDFLWPGRRDWTFRRMPGIGYRWRGANHG